MINLLTNSTGFPVTLSDIKDHLNIDFDDDDNRLMALIESATEFIEREAGISLMPKKYEDVIPFFPAYPYKLDGTRYDYGATDYRLFQKRLQYELPISPLKEIRCIKYYDPAGELQDWSSDNYFVVKARFVPGAIMPKTFYPATQVEPDAVSIHFIAGFDVLPSVAKHLIRLLVAHWNENREAVGSVGSEVDLGFKRLLGQLKTGNYY